MSREFILVFLGGGAGSAMRFLLTRLLFVFRFMQLHAWVPIMLINVLGSFIMGALYILLVKHLAVNMYWRGLILVGLLGGFTTFSSFSINTLVSIENGNYIGACFGVFYSVAGSLFFCFLGISLARAVLNQ